MDKPLSVFHCDNGKHYLVPESSCWLCKNVDIFWDYTNGPYMVLCSHPHGDTNSGLKGKCDFFDSISNNAI